VISPSDFPTKILYAPPICATSPANLILLDFITQIICGECRSYSSLLCSLLHFCYLILLRPKLSSSAPYAQTPQSICFLQFQRPSFTPIQNKRQNYSSVYFSLYIFWQQTGRQKILHRMIRYIPRVQPALNFFQEWNSDLLGLFPNNWLLLNFKRIYYLSLCCDFILHSV
jgi:hypothetical protein